MIRMLVAVSCTALSLALIPQISRAAETRVIEAYACNYNAGKSLDDLHDVVKFYTSQRSKIASPALQKMVSRIWTPLLGNVPYDFIWFNSNLTYREWGESTKAFNNSDTGAQIQARFDDVATCSRSGLSAQEGLFNNLESKPFPQNSPVVIESFLCTLHDGKSIGDSDAALAAWKPVFEKAVARTGASSFVARRIPIIGSGFDLSYFAVWADEAAYASSNETFNADPDSAKSGALFTAAHRCDSALFKGHTLVPPPN